MGALGHDAGHFAASRIPWVNEYGVWAMSLICNPIVWQHQHTYAHHSFTNEFEKDPDIHHFDSLLRVHHQIKHEKIHNHQVNRLWVFFAYTFVCFGTCFWIPWTVISSGTIHEIVNWQDKNRMSKAIGMRFHWYSYILFIIVVPFLSHESNSSAMLAAYVHIATIGTVFAIFSQINHLNEISLGADMINRNSGSIPRDSVVKGSWAAAQVETSNNFASGSLIWHFLSNGLNHQIEHHLFPGLNHGHLQHIAPVVRETCKEYGVIYKSYDTWSDLMDATLQWYDKLSVNEKAIPREEGKKVPAE
jgi:fatty acid desaturase